MVVKTSDFQRNSILKKTAFLMALLICLLQFVACGENSTDKDSGDYYMENPYAADSRVVKFMNFIKEGEYLKAIECYNYELYGNFQLEAEASDGIVQLLNDLNKEILNGRKSELDSKKITGTIDNVLSKTSISVDSYNKLKKSINESTLSKAAFLAGKELEGLKQYVDAIEEYKKVISADSNFKDANDAIKVCTAAHKQNVFSDAASLAENGNYIDAIAKIRNLIMILPNDSDISAKLSVYEKMYISNAINSAEQAFVTPATDYKAALDIINAALQHFPENEDLNAKKTYYQTFFPVNLYDMKIFKGSASKKALHMDIYDNKYEKCFVDDTWVTYYLDKSYNTFKATIYCFEKRTSAYMGAEIYADGKIIYQNLKIKNDATKPFTINLDITGVEELKIVLNDTDLSWNYDGLGMANIIIQKTVK